MSRTHPAITWCQFAGCDKAATDVALDRALCRLHYNAAFGRPAPLPAREPSCANCGHAFAQHVVDGSKMTFKLTCIAVPFGQTCGCDEWAYYGSGPAPLPARAEEPKSDLAARAALLATEVGCEAWQVELVVRTVTAQPEAWGI